ncbi:hypothetical protein QQX98_006281 [Neonectria punicea]|uniref:Protein kinase domain-containing protein n=1 Tax=Neonectria punicea TaxID=979145 RepID=A0ABR1H1K4_9HYPO
MAARQDTLNRRVSDLVVESRIEATWDPRSGQTTQILTAVGTSARQRRLKTEETWTRKRVLGNGAFGTVWPEEATATDGSGSSDRIPKLRAVKEIRKRPNEPASDFHRELEAIAKFSHESPAWWVKIGDFGISKRVEGSAALTTMEFGTRGYMAPEMLGIYTNRRQERASSGSAITPAVDVWAVGEIAHRMLTHKSTFTPEGDVWSYVKEGSSFPVHELKNVGASAQSISFIQGAMAAASRNRLTAEEATKHAWLRSHEFIEETESRSSSESNREMTPTDLALLLQKASGAWTSEVKTPGMARDESNGISDDLVVEESHAAESQYATEVSPEADDGTPASLVTQPTDDGHEDESVVLQKPRRRRRNFAASVADASESSKDPKPSRHLAHKSSINNRKLPQADKDAIQRLVLPKPNASRGQQRKSKKRNFKRGSSPSMLTAEAAQRRMLEIEKESLPSTTRAPQASRVMQHADQDNALRKKVERPIDPLGRESHRAKDHWALLWKSLMPVLHLLSQRGYQASGHDYLT